MGTAGRKPRYHRNETATPEAHTPRASSESSFAASPASTSPSPVIKATTPASAVSDITPVPRTPSVFAGLNERELFIVQCISQGRPKIEQFLIAPSFRVTHHKTFARHLHNAPPWIHDALIATAALLACEYDAEPSNEDRAIGHRRAASAVSTLRTVKTFHPGELSSVLLLAVSAVTFALQVSGTALAICKHALNIIKPVYESIDLLDSDCLALFVCLIMSEAEECLLVGEMPTVRFRTDLSDGAVDRYMGIAWPLLPYLYDVAKVSYLLRQDERPSPCELMAMLDEMESAVYAWNPALPQDCADRFLQEEVVRLLAQAKVFRWFILLMIHRLRYPYGTESAVGTALSDAILKELQSILQHTKSSIPHMAVPLLIACFEVTDARDRQAAFEKSDDLIDFSQQSRIKFKDQLTAFWAIKDIRGEVHWSDVISWLPQ